MPKEHLRKCELTCGEVHGAAGDGRLPRPQIELRAPDLEDGRIRRRLAAKPDAYPREQFLEAKRLRHVVVRPALEAGNHLGRRVAGCEDDDRYRRTLRAQRLEHLQPVASRKSKVENQEVEEARPSLGERLRT